MNGFRKQVTNFLKNGSYLFNDIICEVQQTSLYQFSGKFRAVITYCNLGANYHKLITRVHMSWNWPLIWKQTVYLCKKLPTFLFIHPFISSTHFSLSRSPNSLEHFVLEHPVYTLFAVDICITRTKIRGTRTGLRTLHNYVFPWDRNIQP